MQCEPEVGVGNYFSEVSMHGPRICQCTQALYPQTHTVSEHVVAIFWSCRDILEHLPHPCWVLEMHGLG